MAFRSNRLARRRQRQVLERSAFCSRIGPSAANGDVVEGTLALHSQTSVFLRGRPRLLIRIALQLAQKSQIRARDLPRIGKSDPGQPDADGDTRPAAAVNRAGCARWPRIAAACTKCFAVIGSCNAG